MKRILNYSLSFLIANSSFSYGNQYPQTPLNPPLSPLNASFETDPNGNSNDENGPTSEGLEHYLKSEKTPLDSFYLINQDLAYKDISVPLYSLSDSPLNLTYDHLDYIIEGNDFIVIGTFRGKEIARHIFRGIGIHSFIIDNEILFAVTREGQLHAIDTVFLKRNVFKGPIPVFQNLLTNTNFKTPLFMNFWTRGLPPSIVSNINEDSSSIFPHDRNGKIFFSGGDLVLHRGPKGNSKAFAILSRQVLAQKIEEKLEELVIRSSITSTEVFENLDPKLLAKFESQINMQVSADDLSQLAIRSVPSESIKRLIAQADRLTSENRLYDKASLNEWIGSYQILRKQALKNSKKISENVNLSENWQALLSSAMNDGKPLMQKPGFFKKYGLTMAALTGVASSIGFVYLTDAQSVMVALDYLYAHAVPPILKISEWRFPLLASVTSLISIIPLVQAVAWLSPYTMMTVSKGLKKVSKTLSNAIWNVATTWKSLDIWQRIVTMGARVYSIISVAMWNHLGTILNQPQLFRTLKLGLNPFEQIKKNSALGKKINLSEDMALGVNNPFLNKADLEKISIKQQQSSQYITQENLKTRHKAFQLIALTLYQNEEIDPASLAMILSNNSQTDFLDAKQFKDLTNEKQKEWLALTEIIVKDWIEIASNNDQLFDNISAEDFLLMYQKAKEKINKYKNLSGFKKRLVIFKDQTNRLLRKFKQDTLLLGVSDARLLKTVYADSFVSDQVKKTFVSDHILVAALPAFWGDRADPTNAMIPGGNADGSDRNLLTFRPSDGSLANFWTNPEHMMDIWLNVTAHFFGGAAKQILLYQGEPIVEETNYLPAETFLINQKPATEGLLIGSAKWIANTIDTRKSALGNFYLKTFSRQLRTVQAGLILSLTFRFIATNPTLENALMGWYFFFIAGTWGYAWPWTIIGQGNNLEDKRIKMNSIKLLELQTKLSQALRFSDQESINETSLTLFELYEENPKILEKINKLIGEKPNADLNHSYTIWAHRFLLLTQEFPPFPTQPNPMPSWISTWAGAISTTYLAIPLGILSLDPNFMTASNMLIQTVESGLMFAAAYFLIGKNGLWSKTLDKMDWIRNNFHKKTNGKSEEVKSCKDILSKTLKK